ncbi:hypothetical protein Dimus_004485 [Dionaea muscipula]
MGRAKNCHNCCRNRHLVTSLAFLLISSFTQDVSMAQGNTVDAVKGLKRDIGEKNGMERSLSLIGSRPPRCKTRCSNCGHCEAIQVPIAPQQRLKPADGGGNHPLQNSTPMAEYSRGNDMSNYKPMSWRCKCGDFIFNP